MRLAAGGDGVVKTEIGEVFARGTIPGERVRLTELSRKGARWFARSAEILEPSADRREPPCEIADRCGGCAWMSMSAARQREARRAAVERALQRGGAPAVVTMDPAGTEGLAYRQRARLRYAGGRLGYRQAGGRALAPLGDAGCPILLPAIAEAAATLRRAPPRARRRERLLGRAARARPRRRCGGAQHRGQASTRGLRCAPLSPEAERDRGRGALRGGSDRRGDGGRYPRGADASRR